MSRHRVGRGLEPRGPSAPALPPQRYSPVRRRPVPRLAAAVLPGVVALVGLLLGSGGVGAADLPTAPALVGRAYQEAQRIREPAQRAVALADVAVAQQAGGDPAWEKTLAEAVEGAREPEDHLARALACRGVATRAWKLSPQLAAQVLQAALKLARELSYAAQKALALREIGRSLVELEPATASAAFTEAGAAAAKIESPLFRSAAQRDLAAALPPGDRAEALKLFAAAGAALRGLDPPDEPVQLARIELAVACCQVDLPAALAEAAAIPQESLRQVCYRRLCEALSSSNVEGAMQVAGRLQEPGQRGLAMAALAAQLVTTQAETAVGMARSALRMQEGLSPEEQAILQGSVAATVARVNLKEGLELVAPIEDEALAGRALVRIAVALAPTEPVRAAEVAGSIADWECREQAQAQVAVYLAAADAPAAVKLADGLLSRRDKSRTLLAIAAVLRGKG